MGNSVNASMLGKENVNTSTKNDTRNDDCFHVNEDNEEKKPNMNDEKITEPGKRNTHSIHDAVNATKPQKSEAEILLSCVTTDGIDIVDRLHAIETNNEISSNEHDKLSISDDKVYNATE